MVDTDLDPDEIAHPPAFGATCLACGERSTFRAEDAYPDEFIVVYECQRGGCGHTMHLHMAPGE